MKYMVVAAVLLLGGCLEAADLAQERIAAPQYCSTPNESCFARRAIRLACVSARRGNQRLLQAELVNGPLTSRGFAADFEPRVKKLSASSG
jgi:hypothetical protein